MKNYECDESDIQKNIGYSFLSVKIRSTLLTMKVFAYPSRDLVSDSPLLSVAQIES
jgi:hypothetical protein